MKHRVNFLLVCIISITAQAQINLTNGLRAHYDFSGNALDVSGNGFDGNVNGATLTVDRFGNPNSAYYFDGVNQNIQVTGFQNMITGDEMSVSIWLKADQVKTQSILMLSPDLINDRLDLSVYYSHNGISSTFFDYGDIYSGGRLGSVGTFFQPVWEHYVFVVSSTLDFMQVYRNGYLLLQKSGVSSLTNKNRLLNIGGTIGDNGTVNHFFSGTLDDIRIYDRVLSPIEIMSLHHGYYESTVKDLRVFITSWPNPRPGFEEELYVIYQNVGNVTMPAYVEFWHDTTYTFISANAAPDSVNGNYLGWNIANIPPGAQGYFAVRCSLDASVPLGTQLYNHAVINPIAGDTVPADNFFDHQQTVVGGCDPNDIQVDPVGDIFKSFVESGQWLTYTIRFQNTGTASAVNIRIEDQLENDFYVSSVEILGASHNYTWQLGNDNKLIFNFNNINLPDSGTNYMGSNGFVMYRIKGLPYLQVGDQLTNSAKIFFDFNAPVQTNTLSTTIVSPVGISNHQPANPNSYLYPNPFSDYITAEFQSTGTTDVRLEMFSSDGKRVFENRSRPVPGKNLVKLNMANIPAGVYFFKISNSEIYSVSKLVKL